MDSSVAFKIPFLATYVPFLLVGNSHFKHQEIGVADLRIHTYSQVHGYVCVPYTRTFAQQAFSKVFQEQLPESIIIIICIINAP